MQSDPIAIEGFEAQQHLDTADLIERPGSRRPPYRPTFATGNLSGTTLSETFLNSQHRELYEAPTLISGLIDYGIPGHLWKEDALKLYELAFFSLGNILELGTGKGLSTAIMARGLASGLKNRKFPCMQMRIITIELDGSSVLEARERLQSIGFEEPLVTVLQGDAVDKLLELIPRCGRSFDLVFVDFSHTEDDVAAVCRLLPPLLRLAVSFCFMILMMQGMQIQTIWIMGYPQA